MRIGLQRMNTPNLDVVHTPARQKSVLVELLDASTPIFRYSLRMIA